MKSLRNLALLSVGFVTLLVSHVLADENNYDAIADSMVNESLSVQPGELVVITGNPSEIDLMAALQVAVSKAGGQSLLSLNIPEANKRAVMEMPIEHMKQLPTQNLLVAKMTDVFINVGSVQDPDLFADVPEERMAAFRQSGLPLTRAFNNMRFRSATLGQTGGIPTAPYAMSVGADSGELQEIFWEATAVAPSELIPTATKIVSLMTPDTEIRITSKAGTDLTLKVDQTPARINAGRTSDVRAPTGPTNVWLPAGEAYGCVYGANGTLVVPWTSFRGVPIENLKLTFKNGEMTKMSADSNQAMLEEYFAASSSKLKNASLIDFGLNPHSRSPKGTHYYSWEMGGMLTLLLGNNSWAGGDNDSDAALSLHMPGTSVSIGGKSVINNGELSL
jgi:leucyl aminopeptidase (aminopeptidase T)